MGRDTEMKEHSVYFRNMEQSWVIGKCCIVGSARRVEKTKKQTKYPYTQIVSRLNISGYSVKKNATE